MTIYTRGFSKGTFEMAYGPAMTQDAIAERTLSCSGETPAFNAAEFNELSEMIGEDGVMEMVEIFETETRARLRRLADGNQDMATQLREMHTLKGAAGTVAAPRLKVLGAKFEHAARDGIAPTRDQVGMIAAALEDYLAAARLWSLDHAPVA
jgi:HPt (histidine-containing phosphotransfer) domain-containing protein